MQSNCSMASKSFALFTCLLVTACGPGFIHDRSKFDPQAVTCRIEPIPEAETRIKNIYTNPYGDLYLTSHADSILDDMKYWADRGDMNAMIIYGSQRYELTQIILGPGYGGIFTPSSLPEAAYAGHDYAQMPERYHNGIVMALSYRYIAQSLDDPGLIPGFRNLYRIDEKELAYLEEGRTIVNAPPAWFAEAKANARAWQERCGSKPRKIAD